MKNISLIFITDGRTDLLEQTLNSFHNNISYPFIEKIIVNDNTDPNVERIVNNLSRIYGLTPIHHKEKRGFAGAYDTAFKSVSKDADYAMFWEDDFTLNGKVDIQDMIFILEYNRNLCQVILKRQAWNEEEKKAGGIIEQWPDLYEEKELAHISWCEQRLFFSTNPCLVPKWVIDKGWPLLPHSESVFGQQLFSNPNIKSCFLGRKFDKPIVNHCGITRNGLNY